MSDVPAARGGAPGGGGVLVLEHEGMETKNRLSTMRFFGYLELAGGQELHRQLVEVEVDVDVGLQSLLHLGEQEELQVGEEGLCVGGGE